MRRGIVALKLPDWFDRRSMHRAQCVVCGWLEDPDESEEDEEGGFQAFFRFQAGVEVEDEVNTGQKEVGL